MRHQWRTGDPAGREAGGTITISTDTVIMRPVVMIAMTDGTIGATTGAMSADTATTEVGGHKAPGLVGPGALSGCTYSLAWQMLLNKSRAASFSSSCREIRSYGRQKCHRISD